MRLKLIGTIIVIFLLNCSCVHAAVIGQIVAPDDPNFKEWDGGNKGASYVELSSIKQTGNVLSCKSAFVIRGTREIFDIYDRKILELPDGKIQVDLYKGPKIIDINSKDFMDYPHIRLYKIMKEALSTKASAAVDSSPKGTLPTARMQLGYVSFNDSPQYVTKVYGNPSRVDDYNGMTYYYGDTLSFSFCGVGSSSLYDITTKSDNGIETADGVHVGMLVSNLYDIYGTPQVSRKEID